MINDVYNTRILEFAGNIQRLGRLRNSRCLRDRAFQAVRLHGHRSISRSQDGVVSDFAHDVESLRARAGIVFDHGPACHRRDGPRSLRDVTPDVMLRMLKENGAPPEGRFEDLKFLEPVRDYKARHNSTMLTFDAVVDCLEQIDRKNAEAAA